MRNPPDRRRRELERRWAEEGSPEVARALLREILRTEPARGDVPGRRRDTRDDPRRCHEKSIRVSAGSTIRSLERFGDYNPDSHPEQVSRFVGDVASGRLPTTVHRPAVCLGEPENEATDGFDYPRVPAIVAYLDSDYPGPASVWGEHAGDLVHFNDTDLGPVNLRHLGWQPGGVYIHPSGGLRSGVLWGAPASLALLWATAQELDVQENPGPDERLRDLERRIHGDPQAIRQAAREAARQGNHRFVYEVLLDAAIATDDQDLIGEVSNAYWHARWAKTPPSIQHNPGPDERLRELERAFNAGDLDAAIPYLRALVRAGDWSPHSSPALFWDLLELPGGVDAMLEASTRPDPSKEPWEQHEASYVLLRAYSLGYRGRVEARRESVGVPIHKFHVAASPWGRQDHLTGHTSDPVEEVMNHGAIAVPRRAGAGLFPDGFGQLLLLRRIGGPTVKGYAGKVLKGRGSGIMLYPADYIRARIMEQRVTLRPGWKAGAWVDNLERVRWKNPLA